MYETVLYEKDNGVANIALNRPEKLNAFDGTMHDELYRALESVAEDEEIRCVVLRGEGRGFSAGADLAEIVKEADGDPDLGEYLRDTYSRLVKQMVRIEKPIIAALHGPVYGAGVGLALACDLRIAAENTKFSVAFIKIGLMPDAGVTFLLPRVVGLGRAMEMSMLGDAVEAEEAYRIGLVNKVVADQSLPEEARNLAEHLATMPTGALGRIKDSLYSSFETDLETALETEAEGQTFCGFTQDHKEGVTAFFEKREARFVGR
ncbi:MAG TPA: enoyl-CoA hydratase-related protein [Rubrobacter sp.]|nr:enoyl-CoA hydratase-related protein [Rubrobacter sp.]